MLKILTENTTKKDGEVSGYINGNWEILAYINTFNKEDAKKMIRLWASRGRFITELRHNGKTIWKAL